MTEYAIIVAFFSMLWIVLFWLTRELVAYYNFFALMLAVPLP